MTNLIKIGGIEIHNDAQGRYCLNDLHKAAGNEAKHKPSEWLRNKQAVELIEEIAIEGIPAIQSKQQIGTFACKELVYAYAMWISAKFHLQVIRTFDALVNEKLTSVNTLPSAISPAKEFRSLFGIARLIGCDKSAAAISANQGVVKLTGTNMLDLLGQVHIESSNQDTLFFTPTELGDRIGISGRKLNLLLAEAGFQFKRGEVWEVMEAGKEFARIYDTGKRHGSGVPIQQIKWAATVMPTLKQGEEA